MAAVAIVIFVLGVSMIMCALCAAAGDEDIREESRHETADDLRRRHRDRQAPLPVQVSPVCGAEGINDQTRDMHGPENK